MTKNRMAMPKLMLVILSATLFLDGCAKQISQAKTDDRSGTGERSTAESAPSAQSGTSSKRFVEPEELDKLLDAKPIVLAAVKPATPGTAASVSTGGTDSKNPEMAASGKGKFRIQVGAESDMDAAQSKKGAYEKQLGGTVDMIFDAPYYKLRWGFFDSKQDAEDKLLELSDKKIQGFVVRQ